MEFPGKVLCEEIEYAAGDGAYSENDLVIACVCGDKKPDDSTRTMNVKPAFSVPLRVSKGQVLYGRVDSSGDTSASITLGYDLGSNIRLDLSNDFAMLKIEGVKAPGTFIKSMKDVVRAGDIVKVEVLEMRRGGIDVAMRKPGLGVVKAFCSKCRGVLALTRDNKLICRGCGRQEYRKIGQPYVEVME